MKFKIDEISSVIKREIQQYQDKLELSDVGEVLEVGDGIARVYGLSQAMAGEMVEFQSGVFGQVFNLEEGNVGIVILGDYLSVHEGDRVRCTGELLSVPVGREMVDAHHRRQAAPADRLEVRHEVLDAPLDDVAAAVVVGRLRGNQGALQARVILIVREGRRTGGAIAHDGPLTGGGKRRPHRSILDWLDLAAKVRPVERLAASVKIQALRSSSAQPGAPNQGPSRAHSLASGPCTSPDGFRFIRSGAGSAARSRRPA